ncbi:MAG: hypothetical protein M3Z09_12345 [Acidobacteriota bacterium]|nr:hypothetical protein [Acidobacteriota bacterium]
MRLFLLSAVCLLAFSGPFQPPDPMRRESDEEKTAVNKRLPNGKLQAEEILKADYAKSLNDARELSDLSQSLAADMERDTRHVLSLSSIRKTEEIEKLARRIRGRMRRF